ncbi:MAG: hypothetical protein HQL37_04080, partial [Alphaproteobacteria bacterium]|nr:hypothetical protein [Alphaproteobacteria bacterium]
MVSPPMADVVNTANWVLVSNVRLVAVRAAAWAAVKPESSVVVNALKFVAPNAPASS